MGQIHPSGPNVVRLTQRGAGKNCECGAPYFDEHEIASDARLTQFFPHQEIIQTVQAANTAMKMVYKNILPILIFMIVMGAIVPNVLFRIMPGGEELMICRTTNVCPVVNISMDYSDGGCGSGCQVQCCRRGFEDNCSPEFDERNEYTKKIQSGESVKYGEQCCSETLPSGDNLQNCKDDTYVEMKGNVKNESSAGLAIRVALIPAFFLLFIGAPLGMLIKNQNEVKKALLDTFEPWKAKGIRLEYFRAQKHSPGALYFHLPLMQQYQPQQQTMAGQPTQLVQPYQAQLPGQMYQQQPGQMYQQQPGQMYQQPGQPGMVIQMVQQPGGAFYNQAQQGAQEPKQ